MLVLGASWTEALMVAIALISAPAAVLALFQTRAALRAQAVGSDLQTVLSIWEKIDTHWCRFRKAKAEADKNFEFGQLTGYYELACGLFRDGILSTKAARTLEEHLDEILPKMRTHPAFAIRFDALTSAETTFENITWFCGARRQAK